MRISDWSSDVCSSDLFGCARHRHRDARDEKLCRAQALALARPFDGLADRDGAPPTHAWRDHPVVSRRGDCHGGGRAANPGYEGTLLHRSALYRAIAAATDTQTTRSERSEEHTSELQSLMRTSY